MTDKPTDIQAAIVLVREAVSNTPHQYLRGAHFQSTHRDDCERCALARATKLVCDAAEQHNLSQIDYENLVRDAMRWRKQLIDAAPQPSELPLCTCVMGVAQRGTPSTTERQDCPAHKAFGPLNLALSEPRT
jgi:hypothetical protein